MKLGTKVIIGFLPGGSYKASANAPTKRSIPTPMPNMVGKLVPATGNCPGVGVGVA